jgi:hypothetical protein
MLPFLHDRVRRLGGVLERSSAVLKKYNDLDLDLAPALSDLLDEAVAAYRALNRASVENRMLALKAECVAASHGTNPLTLERVTTNRRTMQRAVALRVLQASAEQVRADIELDTQKLAEAGAQLRPIVLAGIQKGIVPQPWPASAGQTAVERLWRDLRADPDIRLAARQLAMQVSMYDIHLLLGDLLETTVG